MPDIALVTSDRFPSKWYDAQSPLIAAELARRGLRGELVRWHDPAIDWSAYAFVLVRSPWDLYWHLDEFHSWLDRLASHPHVGNSAAVMRWTLDKRYLLAVEAAGVPIVPTRVIEPGDALAPFDEPMVVKPTSSAGATDTARWEPAQLEPARAHVAELHARGMGALVQPYIDAIDRAGERGLVFLGRRFSHAIVKDAILRDTTGVDNRREAHPRARLYEPTEEELALAGRALATVPGHHDLTFARVDLVPSDGGPLLMELELLDASLFFDLVPAAVSTLVDEIVERIGRRGRAR
jgi:glutathione synthase/RimK-type ligase-like ATP-grasp enzyme